MVRYYKSAANAKAYCMLACKDAFVFGSLTCTARRAFSSDCRSLKHTAIRLVHLTKRRINPMKKHMLTVICCMAAVSAACVVSGCSKKADNTETVIESEETTADETVSEVTIEETPAQPDSEAEAEDIESYFVEEPVMKHGTVEGVDADNYSITIDTVYDKKSKADSSAADSESIIFNATEYVPVIDASTGEAVDLKDVKTGSKVYAWAGDTMTLSLPAQMSLQALAVNVPEDASAPVYAVVKGIDWSKDDTTLTIKTTNGETYYGINDKTEVKPYKTKQIVKLSDIRPGSRLMIMSADSKSGDISKLILLSSAE